MNTQEKIEFVENFTNAVKVEILGEILAGKIPEDWDGRHLRIYLAEAFSSEAKPSRGFLGRSGVKAINNRRAVAPLKY